MDGLLELAARRLLGTVRPRTPRLVTAQAAYSGHKALL